MTALASFKPEPLPEMLTQFSARRETGSITAPRDHSLSQILSLTDARRFIPESLGLLAIIVLVQSWTVHAAAGASAMPHPFWIPVLLMSGQYGIMGGLFAAVAASAVFLVDGLPVQLATQDFYDYAAIAAAQPCAWFGSALVLGGLRTLHMHHHADAQARLEQTLRTAEHLADGLERAVDEVERLEHRIATDYTTITALLDSLAKLDPTDPPTLLSSIAEVIRFGVGATSYTIYLKGTNGFEPCHGVVDGTDVSTALIPALPESVLSEPGTDPGSEPSTAGCLGVPRVPLRLPIRAGSGEPIGLVVCTRLHPSRDSAIAYRRLAEICRVLAALLAVFPERARGAVR